MKKRIFAILMDDFLNDQVIEEVGLFNASVYSNLETGIPGRQRLLVSPFVGRYLYYIMVERNQ